MRSLIDSGEYAVGSRLPTERELAEQLKVSRPTVREALIALEVEGRVRIRVGSGIYVIDPADAAPLTLKPVHVSARRDPDQSTLTQPDLATARAELRMNAYATYGGVDRRSFELYALAASIVGKCEFCVKSHYKLLRDGGMPALQLRDVGRIAAVIAAAAHALANEEVTLAQLA